MNPRRRKWRKIEANGHRLLWRVRTAMNGTVLVEVLKPQTNVSHTFPLWTEIGTGQASTPQMVRDMVIHAGKRWEPCLAPCQLVADDLGAWAIEPGISPPHGAR